jgi:hypothetical protein
MLTGMTWWWKLMGDCCGRITDSRVSSWIVAGIRIGRRDLCNRGTYNKRGAERDYQVQVHIMSSFVIRITMRHHSVPDLESRWSIS